MKLHKKIVFATGSMLLLGVIGATIFIESGVYNIGADVPHWPVTYKILEKVRNRSVAVHSASLKVPDLNNPQRILRGAGQYAAMCTSCHLAPGMPSSEIRPGLYPQPPVLAQTKIDPREAFWAIKHGIKLSAMPAWGFNHNNVTIWDIVAFIEKLPGMTPAEYQAMVAKAPPDEEMMASRHPHGGEENAHSPADMAAPASKMMRPEHDQPAQKMGSSIAGKGGKLVKAENMADAFQQALKNGHRYQVIAMLAPDVRVIEGSEEQASRTAYVKHHMGADMRFLKHTKVRLLERQAQMKGDQAVVSSVCELYTEVRGKPQILRSHETLTMNQSHVGWQIIAIRWNSKSVSNAEKRQKAG